MIPAPLPENEEARLQQLYDLDILDTLEEQAYDDITYLVAQICDVPIALISLIDRDRQFLKSHYGLDVNEVPRELGFCPHAILDNHLTVVEDATKDERFHDNPLVSDGPKVRFYAGAPLVMPGDLRVGTLCVVANEPRALTKGQEKSLEVLARQVVTQLELRHSVRRLEAANKIGHNTLLELDRSEKRERTRSNILEKLAKGRPLDEILRTLSLCIEEELKGAYCSILLVDNEGKHLLCGAAPSLPDSYNEAIDGLEFGPGVGSCGNTAATGERTIVSDIEHHPFWEAFKELAAAAGLRSCWSEPITDGSGNVLAIFAIYYNTPRSPAEADILTIKHAANLAGIAIQRKNDERMLIDAKVTAEFANQAKSEFLSTMSHELRTPLNAILGFSGTMKEEIFGPIRNEKYEEYVGNIQQSGEHLLELINDILDLSTIEAGKLEFFEQEMDVAEITHGIIPMVRGRAEKRGVRLSVNVDGDLPLIRGDARRIKQVLLNLLTNAIKFTPEGGEVNLEARLGADGCLLMTVRDTGAGMTEEQIAKAMEPFGQVRTSSDETHEGTGLGLPLTEALVEAQGGTLAIQSQPGKGTAATIRFPKGRTVA
jgi:two-component system cell cycle sensor histidine kinase PleC